MSIDLNQITVTKYVREEDVPLVTTPNGEVLKSEEREVTKFYTVYLPGREVVFNPGGSICYDRPNLTPGYRARSVITWPEMTIRIKDLPESARETLLDILKTDYEFDSQSS